MDVVKEYKFENECRKFFVHVSPYAHQYGEILVPERVAAKGEDAVEEYVRERFNEIELGKPELSYKGVEIDIEAEE